MSKKTNKKPKPRAAKRAVESLPPSAPAADPFKVQPAPKASGGFKLRLRLAIAVLAMGAVYYMSVRSSAPTAPGAVAAAKPASPGEAPPILAEWGQQLKLDESGSFTPPPGTQDLYVTPKGEVIVLTGDGLYTYTNGKQIRNARFGGAPNRSMACDGTNIYVTYSDNAYITKFKIDLSPNGGFMLAGASRTLAAVWAAAPGEGALALCEVDGGTLCLVSPKGKILEKRRTAVVKPGEAGFVYDLASDAQGDLVITDIYRGTVTIVPAKGKKPKVLSDLCPSQLNRRCALLGGNLYVPCGQQGCVLVLDEQGRHKGWIKAKGVSEARAGLDGFLYLFADGDVRKVKPL